MRRDLNFPSGVDISQEEDFTANVSPSLDSRIPNTLINCQKVCFYTATGLMQCRAIICNIYVQRFARQRNI